MLLVDQILIETDELHSSFLEKMKKKLHCYHSNSNLENWNNPIQFLSCENKMYKWCRRQKELENNFYYQSLSLL